MNIEPGAKIADRPAVEVRDFLRLLRRKGLDMNGVVLTVDNISRLVGKERSIVTVELDALVRAGLMIITTGMYGRNTGKEGYALTAEGLRLTTAKVGKRITRQKADTLIDAFLLRVSEINTGDYCYVIDKVEIIGSYAEGAADVGDVDFFVYARSRWENGDERLKQHDTWVERSGRVMSFVQEMGWPEEAVQRHLRQRNPRIHLLWYDVHGLSQRVQPPSTEQAAVQIYPVDTRSEVV